PLRILGEKLEQFELMRCKDDRRPPTMSRHLLKVQLAVAEAIDSRWGRPAAPPNGSLNSRHQFARAEWFGDVVIGSQFKQENFVDDFSDCAQDNHPGFHRDRPYGLAEFSAGNLRKDQVKNHCNRSVRTEQIKPGLTVPCDLDRVVF